MKNLLVPVDFSDVTERVVEMAERLARAFDAKVWLLHCVQESPTIGAVGEIPAFVPVPETPVEERFAEEHQKLEDLTTRLKERGVNAEMILRSGTAVDSILSAADQHLADMIVLGSHGHGAFYELLVGTVTKAVMRSAGRPTLIVPSGVLGEGQASDRYSEALSAG